MTVRLASLNLCWQSPAVAHETQRRVLADLSCDVVVVQETRRSDLRALVATGSFEWWRFSLSDDIRDARLGVAILGKGGTTPLATIQLPADDFLNVKVYTELGRRFRPVALSPDRTGFGPRGTATTICSPAGT